MSIMPENPIRFPLLFEANIALKAKRYDAAFNYMEKLVHDSVDSNSQLRMSEKRLLLITLQNRFDSLKGGQLNSTENNKVCDKILGFLDKVLIPLEGPTSETRRYYVKLKKDCYWYLAESRDGMRKKREVTRRVWRN